MGSIISLSVGQIDIDYGKNEYFQNHAHLFQRGDLSINEYVYVNDDGTPHIEVQEALRRPLSRVVPRLELLGYTLSACEDMLVTWLGNDEGGPVASMEAFRYALRSFEWREQGEYVEFSEANRSVLGVMNEFVYLAEGYRDQDGSVDPVGLSLRLAGTPCGPLYKGAVFPDKALSAVRCLRTVERLCHDGS